MSKNGVYQWCGHDRPTFSYPIPRNTAVTETIPSNKISLTFGMSYITVAIDRQAQLQLSSRITGTKELAAKLGQQGFSRDSNPGFLPSIILLLWAFADMLSVLFVGSSAISQLVNRPRFEVVA
eukprot:3940006-Amphidinium_carterae.1